jgi:hypothetical protein
LGWTQTSAPCGSAASCASWAATASRYVLEHVDSGAVSGRLEAGRRQGKQHGAAATNTVTT